jgi:hypothetical protein
MRKPLQWRRITDSLKRRSGTLRFRLIREVRGLLLLLVPTFCP